MLTRYLKLSILVLVSLLVLRIFLRPLGQDEGAFLTIGQHIAHGDLLYRDFFDHKPPGIHLLISGLYYAFGANIHWYKFLLLLTQLISAGMVWRITEELNNRRTLERSNDEVRSPTSSDRSGKSNEAMGQWNKELWATIFFLFLTIVFEGERFIAEPFVALCLLISTFLYLKYSRVQTAWRLRVVALCSLGVFLGLALLFKQTAILSLFAFYLYMIIRRDWRGMIAITCGLFIPVGLTLLYLSSHNLLFDAFHQIILYNFKYYPAEPILKVVYKLGPYFLYTLPVWLLFIVGAKQILPSLNSHRLLPNISRKVRSQKSTTSFFNIHHSPLLLLLAILPLPSYFMRHYPHYWLQSIPFVAIVAAGSFSQMTQSYVE